MARELAFVLITPYTIRKSRTGNIIARYLGRTEGLDLVAARMFGPSMELTREYADLVRRSDPANQDSRDMIADYILESFGPDPETGRPHRVMLLLFEGEDAVRKIWEVTGSVKMRWGSGQTIRETYGDYITDAQGAVRYFEPAVLVAPTVERAREGLRLWARYSETDGGIIEGSMDVQREPDVHKTVVMLKPDTFRDHSQRAGNIIDILSAAGLRIVGVKKFCMTVAQAEQFYGPVKKSLERRFAENGAHRLAPVLSQELGVTIPEALLSGTAEQVAPVFAEAQFERIVQFMTGYKPSECTEVEKPFKGTAPCLALVYMGSQAVPKIREKLGETDPRKARIGSVRREFGSNIMENAGHASDSPENAVRELAIIRVEQDTIRDWVEKYYGMAPAAPAAS